MRTWIRNADVVVFEDGEHRLLRGGGVIFEDDRIIDITAPGDPLGQSGTPDVVLDAANHLLVPGLINLHCHAGIKAESRLVTEHADGRVFGSGFMNALPATGTTIRADDPDLAAEDLLWELARWGTTTFVEAGASLSVAEAIVRANARVGLRAYVGPTVDGGTLERTRDGGVSVVLDESEGERALEAAIGFAERYAQAAGDGAGALISLSHPDVCSSQLLGRAAEAAARLNALITLHASQNLFEFHEIARRAGTTPLGYLERAGVLSDRAIVAHCVFTSEHPWTVWGGDEDYKRLRSHRVTVAHCPLAYARRGWPLVALSSYTTAGVNVGIGTDTYPRDMIEELRWASLLGKVVLGDPRRCRSEEVFWAATIGGAKALMRDDIGRIAVGARADLVLVDMRHPHFGGCVYDPLRSLIESGSGEAVVLTIVDGRVVHSKGVVTGLEDWDATRGRLQSTAEERWRDVGNWRWDGLAVQDAYPQALRPSSRVPATRDA